MQIKRKDYDPANKRKMFLKTEKVSLKVPKQFNRTSNFYDYLRVADVESAAPDPRGFSDIPLIQDKPNPFMTDLQKKREESKLMDQTLSTLLVLPDVEPLSGQLGVDQDGRIIMKQYSFREVMSGHPVLRQLALKLINSKQDSTFYQQPKYIKMLELLVPKPGSTATTGITGPAAITGYSGETGIPTPSGEPSEGMTPAPTPFGDQGVPTYP